MCLWGERVGWVAKSCNLRLAFSKPFFLFKPSYLQTGNITTASKHFLIWLREKRWRFSPVSSILQKRNLQLEHWEIIIACINFSLFYYFIHTACLELQTNSFWISKRDHFVSCFYTACYNFNFIMIGTQLSLVYQLWFFSFLFLCYFKILSYL